MKFYFAPLEGITGYVFRNTFHRHFGNHIDKYFAPFIFADQCKGLKTKDRNDLLPENNKGLTLVPQILTNNAKDFLHTSIKIKDLGYSEINLNLGCPAGTVVAKKRGSGLLAYKEELNHLLEDIFSRQVMDISIKTRLGKTNPEEFYELIDIYNQYPISELIIHPRVQTDMYNNKPNLEIFRDSLAIGKMPVCYNGDLFTANDFKTFSELFPEVDKVMMGRGLLIYGGLVGAIKEGHSVEKHRLKAFHDDIYLAYQNDLEDERRVLFRMKELWFYMRKSFTNSEGYLSKIKKAECYRDYEASVTLLFSEEEIS